MKEESKKFLYELLSTPSPTGFEEQIQKVVKRYVEPYADCVDIDFHGNLIAGLNTKAKLRVMLAGHCDQIGLMVKHITEKGFLYVSALGGIDTGVLLGAKVTVLGRGKKVAGIIGRKPIHLQKPDERDKAKADIKDIWIDIGAKNKKEAEKLVEIGDPVTFELGVLELSNDLICSPGLDDKVGLFIAIETLKVCSKEKIKVALYSASTVQEEVGFRGARTAAFGINPHIGIAIDVAHAGDNPGQDDSKAPPFNLGSGPGISRGPNINPVVEKLLTGSAKSKKIPYQILPSAALLGNEANAIQVNQAGVAAASIAIPNRYMHTQAEVCSLKDIEYSVNLLAAFLKQLTEKTDLRPGH